jgi:hypothetical protein
LAGSSAFFACTSPVETAPLQLPCSDVALLRVEQQARLYPGRRGECTEPTRCHGIQVGCYSTNPDGEIPERGWVAAYHANGQLRSLGIIRRGKLSGPWREVDERGQLIGEGEYVDGAASGRWRIRDEQGVLQEYVFKNGGLVVP